VGGLPPELSTPFTACHILAEGQFMYFLSVLLLMFVLPTGSVFAEHAIYHSAAPLMLLVGKWFVFWGAGVRLTIAGLRQNFQPRFTSEHIFGIKGDDPLPFVRELGVANFATGMVGLLSYIRPDFILPVAISAAIFYGIAGVRHVMHGAQTFNERTAMISDLAISAIYIAYVGFVVLT
jgi:hypothetical protein